MNTRDVIRAVLDILDQEDELTGKVEIQAPVDDNVSRFRQIFNLLDRGESLPTANTPNEKYASVDAVTTLAGGGLNASKHPADIRVKDPRGYE